MTVVHYVTPENYTIAEQNGISPRALEQRVYDSGWHIEKAISQPPRTRKDYGDWIKKAEQNGISSAAFRKRVNTYGWDYERASTEPLMDRKEHMKSIKKRHRSYPLKYVEQAEKNGICYSTFRSRVLSGLGYEEASTRGVVVRGAWCGKR